MRLWHETNTGLELPTRRTQRFVKPGRTGCRPLAMGTNRPSLPGGMTEEVRNTWTWQGTEEFLGLRAATGRVFTL
jgi:hypothetical protein